jgi:hypothetical protein
MTCMINMNTLRSSHLPRFALVGVLALTSCSGGKETPDSPYVQFDTLGGGDPVIQTYNGPGESDADRVPTGSAYRNSAVAHALCIATGRSVSSHPEQGETAATSTTWYGISGRRQAREYATATYAHLHPADAALPAC